MDIVVSGPCSEELCHNKHRLLLNQTNFRDPIQPNLTVPITCLRGPNENAPFEGWHRNPPHTCSLNSGGDDSREL